MTMTTDIDSVTVNVTYGTRTGSPVACHYAITLPSRSPFENCWYGISLNWSGMLHGPHPLGLSWISGATKWAIFKLFLSAPVNSQSRRKPNVTNIKMAALHKWPRIFNAELFWGIKWKWKLKTLKRIFLNNSYINKFLDIYIFISILTFHLFNIENQPHFTSILLLIIIIFYLNKLF